MHLFKYLSRACYVPGTKDRTMNWGKNPDFTELPLCEDLWYPGSSICLGIIFTYVIGNIPQTFMQVTTLQVPQISWTDSWKLQLSLSHKIKISPQWYRFCHKILLSCIQILQNHLLFWKGSGQHMLGIFILKRNTIVNMEKYHLKICPRDFYEINKLKC